MARALRIQYPGAYYHVTCRGNQRRPIFLDGRDRMIFYDKLSCSLEIYRVVLLAYVCMGNHFHLLLTTPDGNISEFMRHFNISYTSAFNRRHRRVGHLYQGRYKAFLIEADSYLLEVSRYIHLNPVRLRRYADFPDAERIKALEDFKESSFPGYFRPEKRKEFVNYRTILDYRGGDTPRGREAYREFVLSGIGKDMGSLLKVGKGTGIIGDEPFIEWVKAAFLAEKGSCREQPELNVLRKEYGPDDLIDRFARLIGKPRAEICARGKQAPERAMLMELLHRFCHVSQPRIGELVGGLDYSAVSRARKRMRDRMEKDNQFREHFNKLLSKLTEKSRVKI